MKDVEREWLRPIPLPELAVKREIIRLPCQVTLSYKPEEYYVGVALPKYPILVTTFVSREEVEVAREPKPGEVINGRLNSYLYGRRKGCYLLNLPGETVFTGPTVEVSEEYIEKLEDS